MQEKVRQCERDAYGAKETDNERETDSERGRERQGERQRDRDKEMGNIERKRVKRQTYKQRSKA